MTPMPSCPSRRSLLAITGLSLMAACGSVPMRTLEIRAIDNSERPVPCLIVVSGQDWATAAENDQFVHLQHEDEPLRLAVAFDRPEVELVAAAVPVEGGKVVKVPRTRLESTEMTEMVPDVRAVRATDPPRLLFVLTQRTR